MLDAMAPAAFSRVKESGVRETPADWTDLVVGGREGRRTAAAGAIWKRLKAGESSPDIYF